MPKFNQVATLVRYVITANGNWRCPSDVTSILATGFGGGGSGGGGATTASSGAGGGGAFQSTIPIAVTPGTLYTIVIGAGGTAVAASTNGNVGVDTTFNAGGAVGLTGVWSGASGGGGAGLGGGQPFKTATGTDTFTSAGLAGFYSIGSGGWGINGPSAGNRNAVGGFIGGAVGANSTGNGGGGGGAGPEGAGGGGGAGGTGASSTGGTGTSASANTGAGGGGGGAGGGSGAGGTSGAGGSGKLYLEYWTTQTTVVTS